MAAGWTMLSRRSGDAVHADLVGGGVDEAFDEVVGSQGGRRRGRRRRGLVLVKTPMTWA